MLPRRVEEPILGLRGEAVSIPSTRGAVQRLLGFPCGKRGVAKGMIEYHTAYAHNKNVGGCADTRDDVSES